MNYEKYRRFPKVENKGRTWPDNEITKAPIWCSVDLRDGNQSLEIPMTLTQKIEFFQYLVSIGLKEIEIGFPAASDTEFQFARYLIEHNLIPKDVTIQVLTQSREHIIRKTFEALEGCNRAIVHLYNSTSTLQRDVVFSNSMEETTELAISGAKLLKSLAKEYGEEKFLFEYSPESFTGTELDFATSICNSVIDVFEPTKDRKVIINLPATVEMSMPNIYADQIEYMCKNIKNRENVIISLHTHNDRGTGIAASELGLLAGADRIEGTLFGNGERTGNADLITLALNLYSQGIDPKIDFSNIDEAINVYESVTNLTVHQRHPYSGSLVYTAFSGSHQDAINKGISKLKDKQNLWEVPYLPIDPMDVGRSYDPIIRINSQSGKGGVAFLLMQKYNLQIPKNMQVDFSLKVTEVSDNNTKELLPSDIYDLFIKEYVDIKNPIELIKYTETTNGETSVVSTINYNGTEKTITGHGNGVIEAFCDSLITLTNKNIQVKYYFEHSLESGSKSLAITYIELLVDDKSIFGAGIDSNITKSSLIAIVSAVNKAL